MPHAPGKSQRMKRLQLGQVIVQPGGAEDLEAILRIEQESFSAPWTRRMFEVELNENPFGHVLMARLGGGDRTEVIGYVCFWVVFDEVRVMNLAVTPAMRRQGIGRELLRRALLIGLDQGANRALLEVRASNAAALSLYERMGFRRIAVRQKYYTNPVEDAVLMEMEPIVVNSSEAEAKVAVQEKNRARLLQS